MSSFIVAHVNIKDAEKFQTYAESVPATLDEFGGKVALRGKFNGVFNGSSDYQAVAIIKFPDQNTAQAWYQSAAYQALIPTRDSAADVTIASYDELQMN